MAGNATPSIYYQVLPAGGQNNATKPTLADTQHGELQLSSHGALLVASVLPDSSFALFANPSANVQASASNGAGAAGVHHVCTAITASIGSGSTAPTLAASPVTARLRDGSTGAGTILWLAVLYVPAVAGQTASITLSGLQIVGSAATAMTMEFSGAGGANTFETVSFSGYDVTF